MKNNLSINDSGVEQQLHWYTATMRNNGNEYDKIKKNISGNLC